MSITGEPEGLLPALRGLPAFSYISISWSICRWQWTLQGQKGVLTPAPRSLELSPEEKAHFPAGPCNSHLRCSSEGWAEVGPAPRHLAELENLVSSRSLSYEEAWRCYNQGSWLQSIAIDKKPDKKFRLYWGPCCSRGLRKQATHSLASCLREGELVPSLG